MGEKIDVMCKACGGIFDEMNDNVDQLKCPDCGGKVVSVDAVPLAEKENFEDTLREYTFADNKTTPEEARKIREQLLPPDGSQKPSK